MLLAFLTAVLEFIMSVILLFLGNEVASFEFAGFRIVKDEEDRREKERGFLVVVVWNDCAVLLLAGWMF